MGSIIRNPSASTRHLLRRARQWPGLGHAGEIRFEDLVGDIVFVHVWTTWCAPCLAKMPALEALQAQYRDRGLTVLNVSDEPAEVLLEWLEENPSSMLHGRRDDMGFLTGPEAGQPAAIPRPVYLVLDREGAVRGVQVGAALVEPYL